MSAMGAHELNIEFIAQTMGAVGKDNVAFCVKQERADEAVAVLEKMKHELKAQTISRRDNVGLVFTFGPEFRFTPGTAGRVFKLLGGQDINIIAISTSMAAITCVIDDDRIADAVTALKAVFETP